MTYLVLTVVVCNLMASAQAAPEAAVTVIARAIQPGELVVLVVAPAAPVAAVRASAFERALPVYAADARTWHVLAAIDLDVKPGKYPVLIEAGGATLARTTHTLTVAPK